MLNKLQAIYAVFTAGQAVANPAAWKRGQISGGLVAGFLGACLALAKVFGYAVPLTDEQIIQVGGAVVALWGVCNGAITVASTDKLGLPAPPGPAGPVHCVVIERVPEVPSEPPAALHSHWDIDDNAHLCGPDEPVNRSFTSGG